MKTSAKNKALAKTEVTSNLRHFAEQAQESVKDIAYQAGQTAGEWLDDGKHHVSEASEQYIKTVKKHPVQTSFAVLGVGVILGLLLGRR